MKRSHPLKPNLNSLVVAVIVLVTAVGPAIACSVPVFRYALERWRADAFEVIVFHRGPLSDEAKAAIDRLEAAEHGLTANLIVQTVDLDSSPHPDLLDLWNEQAERATLPWMAVYYPIKAKATGTVWSGELSAEAVDRVLDSPTRREVARQLLKGESAVWILLEGVDPEENEVAFERLQKRLDYLEEHQMLPEIEQKDVDNGLIGIDPEELKIVYSIIRLSRENPDEAILINTLLGSESDLRDPDFVERPMVFPVFGRGRALYALIGGGINDTTIDEACGFLIGACSCEVKELNPGTDLLMAVDWERLIEPTIEIDTELPPLTGLGGFIAATDVDETAIDKTETEPLALPEPMPEDLLTISESSAATLANTTESPSTQPGTGAITRPVLAVAGLGVVGVLIAGFVIMMRGGKLS